MIGSMYIVFWGLLITIANPCPTELNMFCMKMPTLYLEEEKGGSVVAQ